MANVIGLITTNYSTKKACVLAEERPVASLPYALWILRSPIW